MSSPLSLSPLPITSHAASKFSGDAVVPGDKSISHRALMLSSQILGTTRISGLLEGEDVLATAGALKSLGVNVRKLDDGTWEVAGVGIGGLAAPDSILDMGNAGTGARLMMGLLASYPFVSTFTGDGSLCSRPMGRVTNPLSSMGAEFMAREGGRLPLSMRGSDSPMPISYTLPVASAQVKSAILLAGLNTPGTTEVIEPEATRDHTERMLNHFGIEVNSSQAADGSTTITLQGQQDVTYKDRHVTVPSDPSSAAFLAVAAIIVQHASVCLKNVGLNPLRTGLFDTLREMGADITLTNEHDDAGEPVADIMVRHSALHGITVPAERAPSMIDEYPVLAVAAAFANGTTTMHGIGELRVKESDRLQAILDGLRANGVKCSADGDTLTVEGQGRSVAGGGRVKTHFDHRIAMSFLVMGMASEHAVTVDDGRAIATSFPSFITLMNDLGANLLEQPLSDGQKATHKARIIAIDGPAASGKGTVARRLAEHFGYAYLDTGSLYRAVGLKLVYADKDPSDKAAAIEAASSINDHDLSNPRLRQESVGTAASIVSAMPEVRDILLDYQRNYAKRAEGAVLDGRDIGTVVCPDADVKLFMTASLSARAGRRHRELQGQGIEVVFDSVFQDLKERDERDSQRDTAPLKAADDAYVVDTTNMRAPEVFDTIVKQIEQAA